jgi:hypothetical protein
MLAFVRNMSLRMRLALLAAFAVGALLIASFVAWRLARATETFAVRQAELSLNAAARDLVRDIRAHPEGRMSLDPFDTPWFDEGKPHRKPRRPLLPPHERIARAISELAITLRDNIARQRDFERAPVVTSSAEVILPEHLFGDMPHAFERAVRDNQSFLELPLKEAVAALEHELIRRALAATNGNHAEAARRLGINRRLLYTKLEEHKLA